MIAATPWSPCTHAGGLPQVTGPPPYTVISTMITVYVTGSVGAGQGSAYVHGEQARGHELSWQFARNRDNL